MTNFEKLGLKMSPSAYIQYTQCPFKFRKKYIDKIPIVSIHLVIGSICHKVMEELVNGKIENDLLLFQGIENRIKELTLEYKDFEKQYNKIVNECVKIVNKSVIPILKFTNNWRQKGTVLIEKWLNIEILNNIKYVGKVDLIVHSNDLSEIIIIDYKTSKPNHLTGVYYEPNWIQWFIYGVLFKNIYKLDTDINARVWYLRSNSCIDNIMYREDLITVEREMKNHTQIIIDDVEFYFESDKKQGLKPKQNRWCNMCEFKNECGILK